MKEENVSVDSIMGHGGLFKTPVVGQRILAAALNAPVTVMETAGQCQAGGTVYGCQSECGGEGIV